MSKRLPQQLARYSARINKRIVQRWIVGSSLLVLLGFGISFVSVLNAYSQVDCTNVDGCSAARQQRLANIQFADQSAHVGAGLIYIGFTSALVSTLLLLIAQHREKHQ